MATYEEQYLRAQEEMNRKKTQLGATKNLDIANINALSSEAKLSAEKMAREAYAGKMQQSRVMGAQMAQSGLANTGYQGLASQKLNRGYQQQQGGIMSDLASRQGALQRQKDSVNLNYNQNLANINASLKDTQTDYTNETNYVKVMNDTITKAMNGGMTLNQFKIELDKWYNDGRIDKSEYDAYILAYNNKPNRTGGSSVIGTPNISMK
jgi:hypothetical protein